MPEIHLRQPRFTYSVCGPFTNNKIYLSKYVYQKELDKACFKLIWLMEILKIYLEEQLLIKY